MTVKRRPQVGILGGTFNPIHLGHLLLAQDALEQARLACVRFIPAALPPHKPLAGTVTARQRLQMVKLAIRGNDRFSVDDLEIRRGGTSYSIDTLMELRRREPGADFHFIIGSDSLLELATWKEIGRLVRLCQFVVVARPGWSNESGLGFQPKVSSHLHGQDAQATLATMSLRYRLVTGHACEIASRDIRERARRGDSIRYLVPDGVFRYIQRHKLYQ